MGSEPNISINGDEARILMVALRNLNLAAPVGTVLDLYIALSAISQVQPPAQKVQKENHEG